MRRRIFTRSAGTILITAAAAFAMLFQSCSSMAGRYIGFRLSPDRVESDDEMTAEVDWPLSESLTIYLDEYGVPHITAGNETDLFFGLGYMQGRDRRFQLEFLKMLAYGRMRELVGAADKSGILENTEITSRMLGFYEDAESLLQHAPPKDLALLEAFASGINEATKREPVPMEFRVLDYAPSDWEPKDSMVIFSMISFGLFKNWELELIRLQFIIHQLGTGESLERALEIFRPMYDLPPHLVTAGDANNGFLRKTDRRSRADSDKRLEVWTEKSGIDPVPAELEEYLQDFVSNNPLPAPTDDPPDYAAVRGMGNWFRGNSASNNWAVDGEWTGTGKAAMAADSHMPHMMPALGYLFHLEKTGTAADSEEYSVIGAGFAGLPAAAYASNGKVAWGATANWADVTDLYIIREDPDNPDFYEYEGKPEPFIFRTEVFKVRQDDGSFKEEHYTVRETRHGVIINDFVEGIPEPFPLLALKRNRFLGEPLSALRKVYTSQTVSEASDAFKDFYAFTGHWALADDSGNIGYTGSVRLPRREHHLGTLPVPGWTDRYEWNDFVSPEELPDLINPANGIIGSANNQVIDPVMTPYPVNFEGSTPYRYYRILQVLNRGRSGRPAADLLGDLQMDDTFSGWEEVAPLLKRELTFLRDDEDPLVSQAAAALLDWDGHNTGRLTGPTVYNIFQIQAFILAMEDEVSPGILDYLLSYYDLEPFVYDLLTNPGNPAWDNRRTDDVETYGESLQAAFRKAVELARQRYGKNISRWMWNRSAEFILTHPFGMEKGIAGFVNRGPLPLSGATDTLFAHQIWRREIDKFDIKGGPVMRVVFDLGDPESSFMSLPGGQSGRPVSEHYDDILPLYLEGKGVPVLMDFNKIKETARVRLVLYPAVLPE